MSAKVVPPGGNLPAASGGRVTFGHSDEDISRIVREQIAKLLPGLLCTLHAADPVPAKEVRVPTTVGMLPMQELEVNTEQQYLLLFYVKDDFSSDSVRDALSVLGKKLGKNYTVIAVPEGSHVDLIPVRPEVVSAPVLGRSSAHWDF